MWRDTGWPGTSQLQSNTSSQEQNASQLHGWLAALTHCNPPEETRDNPREDDLGVDLWPVALDNCVDDEVTGAGEQDARKHTKEIPHVCKRAQEMRGLVRQWHSSHLHRSGSHPHRVSGTGLVGTARRKKHQLSSSRKTLCVCVRV